MIIDNTNTQCWEMKPYVSMVRVDITDRIKHDIVYGSLWMKCGALYCVVQSDSNFESVDEIVKFDREV